MELGDGVPMVTDLRSELNTRLHFLQSCVESLPETAACPSVRILDYSSRDPIEVRNAGVVNTEADKNVQCR